MGAAKANPEVRDVRLLLEHLGRSSEGPGVDLRGQSRFRENTGRGESGAKTRATAKAFWLAVFELALPADFYSAWNAANVPTFVVAGSEPFFFDPFSRCICRFEWAVDLFYEREMRVEMQFYDDDHEICAHNIALRSGRELWNQLDYYS
jgi:hypothetical protein